MKTSGWSFLKTGGVSDLLALTALWCLAVIVVNPIGNFPLNDDWSCGLTVKFLREHGDFRPSGWIGMTFISQALWGDLFCLPSGFSFTALRISTLTVSWIGVMGFYALMRQLGQHRRVAFICALVLAFNPVYFALSNTFMTDVPFTTMAILSLLFYIRYFQTESMAALFIALAMTLIATLCRQLGLVMALAFAVTLLLKRGFQRHNLVRALTPSVVSIGVWAGYNHWLKATGRTPANYNVKTDMLLHLVGRPWTLPLRLAHNGWDALMYLGCFLFPALLLLLPAGKQILAKWWAKAALVLFIVWSALRFVGEPGAPRLMPVHGNVLDPRGIGPMLLQDGQRLYLRHVLQLPTAFWFAVTLLSIAGAAILFSYCSVLIPDLFFAAQLQTGDNHRSWRQTFLRWRIKDQPQSTDRNLATFFLFCALTYLVPLVIAGFFDRYLITSIVFLIGFLASTMPAAEKAAGRGLWTGVIFFLACSSAYAIAGTRDYLTWNRVRWTALANLQRNNILPQSIDGGFEFNGWYLYDPNYKRSGGKSDWWVIDNEYMLSFGDTPGFTVLKEYDYARWLPPSRGKILVLKKVSDQSTGN